MSKHKYIDKICCVIIVLAIFGTVVFMSFCNSETVTDKNSVQQAYDEKIFSTDTVHSIDIIMDENEWDEFLKNAASEEYMSCTLVIDGETYKNVAIRAKGNTSLTSVASYGNNRYSFKIEFDHYTDGNSYYGLDKLILNNMIQDNTYMKDYLTYQLMNSMGADAPLCSYANISVNGNQWGLYLALEAVEDSFLTRNYGSDTAGDLYKPDNMNMAGSKDGAEKFKPGESKPDTDFSAKERNQKPPNEMQQTVDQAQAPPGDDSSKQMFGPGGERGKNGNKMGMGSDDVCLVYTDNDYSSYSNIFDNAKTSVSNTDKERLILSLKQLNEGDNLDEVVNIDEVLRYFVVHNFVVNFDSYTGSMIHNYYLYEEEGKLSMIAWDYNLAFGTFSAGKMGRGDAGSNAVENTGNVTNTSTSMVNYPIDTPVFGGDLESRPMIAKLLENQEYLEIYHKYFAEFISESFDSGHVDDLIDKTKEMILPYVKDDATAFCTYEEFLAGTDTLKEFCSLRAESVSGQLAGTIPATTNGQNDEASKLIDASSLNLTEMGSMGGQNRDIKENKNDKEIKN
ncbi:CotH kinase family protein [Anaerosacchariphilus polymeriproducens]|uniref:Spore coat protein CotH n=1 Tax=Anaerosacchariphilus polymeriproducens TaxID=1812858 RepID=A0A371AWL8_9FIRM|nr:CotH kinase family protein [Anaerosacchariphilus polymeriproducens]RDU23967.1 spore coat protein CotH [Anaerosacchariphilus polymeriproducens]